MSGCSAKALAVDPSPFSGGGGCSPGGLASLVPRSATPARSRSPPPPPGPSLLPVACLPARVAGSDKSAFCCHSPSKSKRARMAVQQNGFIRPASTLRGLLQTPGSGSGPSPAVKARLAHGGVPPSPLARQGPEPLRIRGRALQGPPAVVAGLCDNGGVPPTPPTPPSPSPIQEHPPGRERGRPGRLSTAGSFSVAYGPRPLSDLPSLPWTWKPPTSACSSGSPAPQA